MSTNSEPDLRITDDPASATATYIAQQLSHALQLMGRASLAISGGNTPTPMFKRLASANLDWSKIHVFWVDERCVPPTSDQSNFKSANEALLKPASIPSQNTHRICGEAPPTEAAAKYIDDIKMHFSLAPGQLPIFDVLHRGMGPDAHTASLFPGEPLINDRIGIAAHVWVEKMKMDRVTLLPGVLLAAERTVLEVVGADKAEPLYQVLYGQEDPLQYPCQLAARNSDRAVWFLDKEAAARVPHR